MSPEARKRVFEPFYTSKPFGDGSGLGLAALHGTVTQLGGSVGVASEIGEGSTFTVLLPTAVPEVSQPEPAGSDRPLDVLVVDDEEIVRDIAREMLVMLGHRPLLAASGPEALQQLQGDPAAFDLVLLDLVMPEMSGADVFRRLREIAPQLPVVICSGYSHNEQVGSLIDEGALGFLHKPFDSHDLEVAIDKALSPEGPRDRRSG
jgi:CheY-like chemotaxis protein